MENTDAWSLYWQGSHQESCIANNSAEDQSILLDSWRDFALSLKDCSTVLDLATGNGSVPNNLLKFNPLLDITAVDRANINPQKHIEDNFSLKSVEFIPNIDITKLPFKPCIFDAITSQFGLEYSALGLSTSELVRVLKPQGQFLFIMHHQDSEVVAPARSKVKEFDLLFKSDLLASFESFLNGDICLQQLNATGEKILNDATWVKSQAITGQIFSAIDQLIQLKEKGQKTAVLMQTYQVMKTRVFAESSRLEQLISASLSKKEVIALCKILENLGTNTVFQSIDLAGNAGVLGWKIKGSKL
ncbi:methyltransferase domain-containing protein [Colwellia sp. MB3u-70]|uniref:class I SAM-dependent methyltransferase n=1 Tax=unclassified Colwellia TaxID=196834 RepID=UPI0015F6EFA0|nr:MULTISPECIES: class I SAM-dependent methyltransferase [unclassified Colwellia]MBA6292074.1 methyltransferase domain-containing protein [Colwellia sp. MB3u-8]MBA6309057.1 methyltransferase domain-containing protein [Colwellia sp. MB3u-70]